MKRIIAPFVAALPALLVLSGPALAQLTEAQAVKQFKSATKTLLKQQKVDLAAVEASFESTLSVLQAGIEAASPAKPLFELLLPDMLALQNQAEVISTNTESFAAVALRGILLELADGDTPDGIFPITFYAHSGGVWDDFQTAFRANHAKAWAKLGKRARKVVKAAAKAGFALTLRIDPPALFQEGELFVNEGEAGKAAFGPMTLDIVIGGSSLAAEGDGLLLLGGTYNQSDVTNVTVSLFTVLDGDSQFLAVDTPTLTDPLGSWGVVIDGGGTLPEGNYQISISQPGDDSCPEAVTGVLATAGIP